MRFVFEQIRTGGDRNFGYLIGDRSARVAMLVDPSYTPEALVERAQAQDLQVTHILNTHGHPDHTNGNARAIELTGAPLAAFAESALVHPDLGLKDGARLPLGRLTLRFWHTPGHCEDHLVLLVEEEGVALTGDLIFVGKVGGTGDEQSARVEWNSLQRILQDLTDPITLWPGHDYGCRPASTVGLERRNNPFLACRSFQEFLSLKQDWPIFKAKHGLR